MKETLRKECYWLIIAHLLDFDTFTVVLQCCSLAPLVKKVSEARVVEMTSKLCDKLLHGKDQHRDTASIALKTVVAEVTSTPLAQSILVCVSPQLIKGITSQVSSIYINAMCQHLVI